MKTLYLSDMDGTLLNNEGVVSDESKKIINELSEKGLLFSVATARSVLSAKMLLDGIKISAPAVMQSGVVIYDFENKRTVKHYALGSKAYGDIIKVFEENNKAPFSFFLNREKEEYEIIFTHLTLPEHKAFYEARHKMLGSLIHKVEKYEIPIGFDPIFVSLCDKYEDLLIIKEQIEAIDGVGCSFYKDTYTPLWFLEVFNVKASKADGLLFVKKYTSANKAVAFGDNLNDLPLFNAADEKYAVENAVEELKGIADGIIKSNEENGVAEYLRDNAGI